MYCWMSTWICSSCAASFFGFVVSEVMCFHAIVDSLQLFAIIAAVRSPSDHIALPITLARRCSSIKLERIGLDQNNDPIAPCRLPLLLQRLPRQYLNCGYETA